MFQQLAMLVVLMVLPHVEAQEPRGKGEVEKSSGIVIHNGFYKGEDFRKRSELEQRAYAAGMVDGMLLAPFFGAPTGEIRSIDRVPSPKWLAGCVVGMTDEQVAAIVSKYLRDHPERWHQGAKESVFSALFEACPKPPEGDR